MDHIMTEIKAHCNGDLHNMYKLNDNNQYETAEKRFLEWLVN